MTPRVHSDQPLEILKKLARDNLPTIWCRDWAPVLALVQRQVPPHPISDCFADKELTQPVDLAKPERRLIVNPNNEDDQAGIVVVGFVDLDGVQDSIVLIQDDLMPVVALQTSVTERKDGTLQLWGGEAGVVLLTPVHLKEQVGKKLQRGVTLRGLRPEKRNARGAWVPAPIVIPNDLVKSVTEDED